MDKMKKIKYKRTKRILLFPVSSYSKEDAENYMGNVYDFDQFETMFAPDIEDVTLSKFMSMINDARFNVDNYYFAYVTVFIEKK